MPKNDGGPAFPCTLYTNINDEARNIRHGGVTKRQYYAAKAMRGFISNPKEAVVSLAESTEDKDIVGAIIKASFEFADAMIAYEESETEF